jgi:heme-degrading monooxygenase HmoA
VARAFLNRPRLVEQAEGFLGLEVFTDRRDASVFYLSTRWTTEAAFRQWHTSEAHHASHQGLPKGLDAFEAISLGAAWRS